MAEEKENKVKEMRTKEIKQEKSKKEGDNKKPQVGDSDIRPKGEVKVDKDDNKTQKEKVVGETEKKESTERKPFQKGKYRRKLGPTREEIIEAWDPKTKLGIEVKKGKIKNIDEILDKNIKILEKEIVDSLIIVQSDLMSIGQSKGKFGGGKRRAWRQTQRKTKEGNVPTFSALAVIGDEHGHVGIGYGKSMETLPARDKAIRKAKLNIIKVVRGDGSFDSVGGGNTSIPFKIEGKAGSVRVVFMPAPPGTGLVVADQLKKILKLAGIKDIYSKTFGKKRTTFNLAKACIDALKKTNKRYQK